MTKKYPRSEALVANYDRDEVAYMSFDGTKDNRTKAFVEYSKAVDSFVGIRRSNATWFQDLSDLQSNVSGRPGLSKSDYYRFRPDEAPKRTVKGAIAQVSAAYQNIGLLRNVIDLMGDFACQGIRLVHPNKKIEKFYQDWFNRVSGKDRSERFLNNLYKTANVVINRQTQKISHNNKTVEIPWKYTFLNPLTVEVIGGPLSSFVGQKVYAIQLGGELRRIINSPKTKEERALVAKIPADIKRAAKTNKHVLLDPDKTSVFHYKKDDWQEWAFPMAHAIMDDLMMVEKLKLADMAALDGAISNIRIFKLGSLEHKIIPKRAAMTKLAEILESNVGGGTMDLIWGPDIELVESKTTVHQFLGEEKYKPHLFNIYAGIGVPPTLTGHFGGSGTTNNFISLKTLIQRLEYGRTVLKEFWTQEIKIVQDKFGFRFPAKIEFDINVLGDEHAEKALLIQLADRSLISDELLQERYGHDPQMEKIRTNREQRDRNAGRMVPKSSPYHDPQFGIALKKIALQTSVVSPGQVGLRKEKEKWDDFKMYPAEDGEKPGLIMRQQALPTKQGDQPQKGRPKNSKDKEPRKKKDFKPKVRATLEIWARMAQVAITEYVNEDLLKVYNKKNLRSLSAKEHADVEKVKMDILFNLEPLGVVDASTVLRAIGVGSSHSTINEIFQEWLQSISMELSRPLTIDESRLVQSSLYAYIYGEDNED